MAIEGFTYRSATGLLQLPVSCEVGIAPTGGDVIATFPFELAENGSYVVVATGLLGDTLTPFDLAATGTTFGSSDAGLVGLEVYHGSTDAPAVDVQSDANDGSVLISNLEYGSFSGYAEVPASDYTLGIAPAGSDAIAAFTAPLSGLGGGSAVVFASGFLSGDEPVFGLFAALNDGTVLALPAVVQDCAGQWAGSAVEDCAGVCEGTSVEDCAGICDGDTQLDACGVCDGPETDPNNCYENTTLWISNVDVDDVEDIVVEGGCDLPLDSVHLLGADVIYNFGSDVAGFQFEVDGTTANSAAGGAAADAGFQVSTAGSTVLGFSFTGSTVPAGCGTLTTLDLSGDAEGLSGLVFSDTSGGAIEFEYYVIALGCTDESACNFDSSADYDDGSCCLLYTSPSPRDRG